MPTVLLGLFSEINLQGHKEHGKETITVVGGGNFY